MTAKIIPFRPRERRLPLDPLSTLSVMQIAMTLGLFAALAVFMAGLARDPWRYRQ